MSSVKRNVLDMSKNQFDCISKRIPYETNLRFKVEYAMQFYDC